MLHLAVERRHLRYLRRGSVFRETAHATEQQGKFSSTTLIRSKPRVGFGTTRWPLMRRPLHASSGVISAVTKTIGTSCSAQSASSCVATSRPSDLWHDKIDEHEIGLKAAGGFQRPPRIVQCARKVIPGLFEKQLRAARKPGVVIHD